MTKYSATFSDGTTITRKTKRAYGVAWRATWNDCEEGREYSVTGFAVSREKASPYRPMRALVFRRMSSANRALAMRTNAEYLQKSGYKVEYADAVEG